MGLLRFNWRRRVPGNESVYTPVHTCSVTVRGFVECARPGLSLIIVVHAYSLAGSSLIELVCFVTALSSARGKDCR